MSALRAMNAVRRIPLAALPSVMPKIARPLARSASSGHDDHHHGYHPVFDTANINPMGAPLGIFLFVVVGGAGVVGFAYSWALSGWKEPPPPEPL